ncbi:MAG: aminotransferase class V-fold PLP-dependent enzyme [Bryobacterales bacterium]|nr:aminotransferase class V-fold PLP-dependent enzyme [Bryobacterales bacterium]
MRAQFPYLSEVAYLDTAAEGLLPLVGQQGAAGYTKSKARGSSGRPDFYATEKRATETAAALLGAPADSVAVMSSASEGLNLLAHSIDWREGDEVIITDLEFPSNVYPWLKLQKQGVKVIVIEANGGVLTLEDFKSRFTPRTRLVSVSFVSFKTGTRLPYLPELGAAAAKAGALLSVDATQGLGRAVLPLEGIDYLVSSSYKWMMGLHGAGVVYLGPRLRDSFEPGITGWYAVTPLFTPYRFERFDYKPGAARLLAGMPNYAALYALEQGIKLLLERGVARIEDEFRPLVRELRKRIERAGFEVLTPADEACWAGIVSFSHPEPLAAKQALERAGVIVWAGDNRVRAAVHFYNNEGDLKRLFDALPALKT